MAQTVDLTKKTLTITNNHPAVAFDCAGMRTGPFAVAEGVTAYLNNSIFLPMYQTNVQMLIPAGDSVKLTCVTADEVAHYLNACEALGLDVVAA